VELITVAGHHQPPARVVHPAKSEQAHGLIVHGLRSPAPFPARSDECAADVSRPLHAPELPFNLKIETDQQLVDKP
jgi:hypothetical protein